MGYSGAVITPFYDSAAGEDDRERAGIDLVLQRMLRALRESESAASRQHPVPRERHPQSQFRSGRATTDAIDTTPELFFLSGAPRPGHAAFNFIGNVRRQRQSQTKGYRPPKQLAAPPLPAYDHRSGASGHRQLLLELGPTRLCGMTRREGA